MPAGKPKSKKNPVRNPDDRAHRLERKVPSVPRLNAEWHQNHRMPKRATLDERLAWHLEHEAHCACRPMPDNLRDLVRARHTPTSAKTPKVPENAVPRKSGRTHIARTQQAPTQEARSFAAFLRGVSPMNLKMADLKACLEAAQFEQVRTILSSGNARFTARRGVDSTERLECELEAAMQLRLGRSFPTIVRRVSDLQALIERDPFARFVLSSAHKRIVTFLKSAPTTRMKLPIELGGASILAIDGREVLSAYVPTPRGPVFMSLIEKHFGKNITTRTWETIRKVAK